MTSTELAQHAAEYLSKTTCYLKGTWGQKLTAAVYQDKLRQYPDNSKYNNEKYVGTDVYPFDCVCFVKSLIANPAGTVDHRITYKELCAGPLGDCTTEKFYNSLYDCCAPMEGKAGYGLATQGHAAICLGNGQWLDVNYSGSQNGLALHNGFSGTNFKCGKIPGIAYENPEPVVDEVREFLAFTANYLYDLWRNKL